MKIDIIMPKMGESVTEGTIIGWKKKVGDRVKKDEIIFEISTDKVDTEIPSPSDGFLSDILVNENETVAVGVVVGKLNTETNVEVSADTAQQASINSTPEPVIEKENKVNTGDLIDVLMPKMGESVMEGTIIKWHKKVGDTIKKEEILFEISTDKVDTEVPSAETGVLAEILVQEQATVSVNTVVARISLSGIAPSKNKEITLPANIDTSVHDVIGALNPTLGIEEKKSEIVEKIEGKFFSPLVMSIASVEGVSQQELLGLVGTGVDNRVTKKDILSYIENRKKTVPNVQSNESEKKTTTIAQVSIPNSTTAVEFPGSIEKIPMDNIRQKIMQHMVKSRDTSVHVSAVVEVDMSKIYNYIQKNRDSFAFSYSVKLTYMPFIARATVKALKEFPLVNSTIDGNTIIQKKFVNLGIAVAVEPNGLIVPNIKNAQDMNLAGVARAVNDLAVRSRTRKLSPEDISGGTFTITNYGVFGTLFGTPIINQPEVAILGVGAVVKRAVVIESEAGDLIGIKPMMYLTLSHDHRLVDGMLGGKFLKSIKDALENFDEQNLF